MSVPVKGNVLHDSGNKLHPVQRGTGYALAISKALKMQMAASPHATKKLMRWTRASERTVKGWLSGAHGPRGEHLVELIGKSDEVWDALRRLAKRQSIEIHHLMALKTGLEMALASIDTILDSSNRRESQS